MTAPVYCAGGCGTEGPFEAGDRCHGCIQADRVRDAKPAARALVEQAAAALREAATLDLDPFSSDMLVRLAHDCSVAVPLLVEVDQHERSVLDVLAAAGPHGLPLVAVATRSGLAADVLSTTLRALMEAGRIAECWPSEDQPATNAAPRYKLAGV